MQALKRSIPLWVLFPLVMLSFGVGAVVGRFFVAEKLSAVTFGTGELREGTGRLTNPLLECEVFGENGVRALRPFKYRVEALLQEKIADRVLTEGSVYFRDLNNGFWFGINEDFRYHPASLLKVPIMMACFKLAEKDPAFLSRQVVYHGDFDISRWQAIEPSLGLVPGESYAVEELIERMVKLSDNNATQLLVNNLDPDFLERVLSELDVNVNPQDHEHFISMHGYAGFFRVLYNASYLNRRFSERALQLLSEGEFAEGLRAGLPPGQLAATKFGESGVGPDPEIVQLHEVGIVYYPGRPYLLGIMTRGQRGGDFAGVIRDISWLVYESVATQNIYSPAVPPSAKVFN